MNDRSRARMRRLIEQEVLGGLPSRHRERLHEHLRSNLESRAEYDRTIEAFRVLEQRDVSRMELDLVERWLFEGASVVADARTPRQKGALGRVWAIAAVTLAAAAAAVLALRTQVGLEYDEYMGVRDGSTRRSGLAIDALCGASPDGGLRSAAYSGCPLRGTLSFAYRVDPAAISAGVLTLFGIDEAGGVSYYAPTPVDADPVDVEIGRWQPLPMSVALEVNHAPGRLRLHAVVTPVPLDVEDVDEAVEILRTRPVSKTYGSTWIAGLRGQGRIARICAVPEACPSAELTFRIHEDAP